MKILLVTSFFPPTHTAGTEKRTLAYALGLQKLGHDVQVVCAGKWDEGALYWGGYVDEVYQRINVRRVHLNWTLAPDPNQYLYYNPIVEDHLGLWLTQWKPDVMHVTSCLTLSASVIQSAQDKSIPVVLTLTDFWFICPRLNLLKGDGSLCDGQTTAWECLKCKLWDSGLYRRISLAFPDAIAEKLLVFASRSTKLSRLRGLRGMALNMEERKAYLASALLSADCTTAPSTALADIIRISQSSMKINVIHSGHDLSWLASAPSKKPSKVLRIAYIGQIIPIKGVHTLLSAYYSAGIAGQAELFIFGDQNKDPYYLQKLEKITATHKVLIDFKGPFSHDALGTILSEIDVVVVPSLWHENNPRVIQEAYATRTPVIASDVAGISEFVQHEVNGLLFERGNVNDLARQMKRLIDEPDLFGKLKEGIPKVKSVDEEVLELEAIYFKLLATRQRMIV